MRRYNLIMAANIEKTTPYQNIIHKTWMDVTYFSAPGRRLDAKTKRFYCRCSFHIHHSFPQIRWIDGEYLMARFDTKKRHFCDAPWERLRGFFSATPPASLFFQNVGPFLFLSSSECVHKSSTVKDNVFLRMRPWFFFRTLCRFRAISNESYVHFRCVVVQFSILISISTWK